MIELYTNNAQTAVAGGGYTSGSLVLNVTSTGAPFAAVATGVSQMHLLIYRVIAGTPTPIVNLVASNTVSGTQWAVAAEGADANALAGDIVICVLSKAGMDQIKLDVNALAVPWTGFTYSNGWADFGGGLQAGQFCRDQVGRVFLRGVLSAGTLTAGTLIITLPAGSRPAINTIIFGNFSTGAGGFVFRMNVASATGQITLDIGYLSTFANLEGLSLSVL